MIRTTIDGKREVLGSDIEIQSQNGVPPGSRAVTNLPLSYRTSQYVCRAPLAYYLCLVRPRLVLVSDVSDVHAAHGRCDVMRGYRMLFLPFIQAKKVKKYRTQSMVRYLLVDFVLYVCNM